MSLRHWKIGVRDGSLSIGAKYALGALGIAGVLVVAGAAIARPSPANDTTQPVPVVVELFTSEGCSSCPPVDTFVRKLDAIQPVKGVQIIGVEEHVTYWNQDGWVDPYSGAEWTFRQEQYASKFKDKSPYTPQLIVDGDKEMVNPNPRSVVNAIQQAAQQESVPVTVKPDAAAGNDEQKFQVTVGNAGGAAVQGKADVFLAVTEEGLQMSVTAGENKGRTLEHAAVVRSLEKVGTISGKDKAPFSSDARVKIKPEWNKPNLRVVVFVQDRKSMRIVGAASAKITG
jgi:hypothetical protein